MNKVTGTVKWFSDSKGFGFLTTQGVDGDIFVHYSAIIGGGLKSLSEEQEVEFELESGQKGYHAYNVLPLSPYQPNPYA